MKFRFRFRRLFFGWMLLTFATIDSMPVAAKPPKMRDIADSVAANPILTNFAAMVKAADLGTFLSSRGPFTLFVPTDSAFAKLPPGTLETLLRPENKVRLQDIVLFHVVNGKRLSAKELVPLRTVLSCEGDPLFFKASHAGTLFVLKAKVTHADIRCQNGMIAEIDTVLMPPESALPPLASPVPVAVETPGPADNSSAAPVATNAPPVDTNAVTEMPIAPVATPDVTPH
jgi:uncharacterized surface protein with fasciclin (FAS1) repeats